jgi:hypothetical protein
VRAILRRYIFKKEKNVRKGQRKEKEKEKGER